MRKTGPGIRRLFSRISLGCWLLMALSSVFLVVVCGFTAWRVSVELGQMTLAPLTPAVVAEFCRVFDVSQDDPFCADSTEQNPYTLLSMMRKKFPPDSANYESIAPYLKNQLVYPRWCFKTSIEPAIGFCPPPSECEQDYSCDLSVKGYTSYIFVLFDKETGQIIDFTMPPPGS
jgi:hypothetical protein